MTFTRRDVAAMRLAYECLRGSVGRRAVFRALELGPWDIYRAAADAAWCVDLRLLRARLALLLRCLLRVAEGDYGKDVRCEACNGTGKGDMLVGDEHERYVCRRCLGWGWHRVGRYTPLWELARSHD